MKISKQIKRIQLTGVITFPLFIGVIINLFIIITSLLLDLFNFNSSFPTIVIITFLSLLVLIIFTFLTYIFKNYIIPSIKTLELKVFSERKFLLDTIIEAEKKNIKIDIPQTDLINPKLNTLNNKYTLLLVGTTIIFVILTFLNIKGITTKGINEFILFLSEKPKITYNRFISITIPLRVELLSSFSGDFYLNADKLYKLEKAENLYKIELSTTKTNIDILVQKYGIWKKLDTLNLTFLHDLTIINQNVKVFYKNIEIQTYDYLPSLEVVEGSRVIINFEFSHPLKKVIHHIPITSKNITENQLTLEIFPRKSINFDVEVEDKFGRKTKIEGIQITIKSNDIPNVIIKYPEKDLTPISSFILNGYGEIVDNDRIAKIWMNIYITNRLTSITKTKTNLLEEKGIKFLPNENFEFEIDSIKAGLLPGDEITISIFAQDIYGAIGKNSRKIYLPTFSEITRMLEKELSEKKTEISKQREEIRELQRNISRNRIDTSKLLDKLENLKSTITNLQNFSEKLSDIYSQLDRTKTLQEDIKRIENISKKLENILSDREFKEIVEKLTKDRTFNPQQVSKKLEDINRALTELEIEINKLNEMRDILKSLSQIRELEEILKRERTQENQNEFDQKLKEFLNSKEFNNLSQEFKTSFMEKLKQIQKAITEKNKNNQISQIFKDIDFEIFKEIMKKVSEINRKQKERFWDVYFKVLSSQVELTKSKKNVDILSLRFPRISIEYMSNEFSNVSESIKEFRITMRNFLNDFALDPNISMVYYDIETIITELEKDFTFFRDAVSSGISYNISQSIGNMINKTSKVLYKLLELQDKMNEGINLSPSGVNLSSLMEMYKQIMKMLSEMLNEGINSEKLSQLEQLLQEAIKEAENLRAKNPGDSRAKEIVEQLKDILNKVKEQKISSAYEKSKEIEFNLLEYQRGMFEKGLSEKREAERPKPFTPKKPPTLIETTSKTTIKDSYIRSKYLEVINSFKKLLSED